MIWTAPDIATVMQDAPLELQQAMSLALHMGQRYGDLIRLRWADYRGETDLPRVFHPAATGAGG